MGQRASNLNYYKICGIIYIENKESENFNLEILENVVIFSEVYTAKTTYKQRGRKIQNWKSSTHFDKTSTHFQ